MTKEAEHAIETIKIALWQCDNEMTKKELRECIRKLYGDKVDKELQNYFRDIKANAPGSY